MLAARRNYEAAGYFINVRCRSRRAGEHVDKQVHVYDEDHPAVWVGEDNGPTPAEFLHQALGSCLMAGVAAARRIDLYEVTAKIEGNVDRRRPARHQQASEKPASAPASPT
jgi:uncharacterized OsmC-like protein